MNWHKVAAALLSLVILLLVGVYLVDYTPFALGQPPGTTTAADAWRTTAELLAEWLWSYRVIDVLIQVTLLLTAVLGASAMFRVMHRDREEG